ncbi:MAG: riboflavin synthase [Candidatus Omnitrophica bacterium]|nr:riboflavin synthase [Candidatus Omnitrophota bacterium]
MQGEILMFTGMIKHLGVVQDIARGPRPRLTVTAPKIRAKAGDSIAVDGVCLTVAARRANQLSFDLLQETLMRTNLRHRRLGDRVHLETALRIGESVGGHWVLGHVDATARVIGRRKRGSDVILTVAPPVALKPYLAPQGSVALNGVSLTVARVGPKGFEVHLVPETVRKTLLGNCRPEDWVNIEVDPIARYAVHRRAAAG